MRRILLLFLTTLLAAVLAAPAAWAGGDDDEGGQGRDGTNAAIAVNTRDGRSIFDLAFDIERVTSEVVDQQNVAYAESNCVECQTVAVAIQIVLVFSDPSVVKPENYGIAVNYECDTCTTVASAYQLVLGVPEGFQFSKDTWRRIKQIRKEIAELGEDFEDGDLSAEELRAAVDALYDELRSAIREDVARGGRNGGGDDDDEGDDGEDDEGEGDEGEDDGGEPDEDDTSTDTDTGTEPTETTTVPTETTPTETTTTP